MLLLKGFSSASDSKESFSAEDQGSIPELGRSSGQGMATHSSIFAWRIPWTEEPGGLQSIGLQRVNTAEQLSYYGKSGSESRSVSSQGWWVLGGREEGTGENNGEAGGILMAEPPEISCAS